MCGVFDFQDTDSFLTRHMEITMGVKFMALLKYLIKNTDYVSIIRTTKYYENFQ